MFAHKKRNNTLNGKDQNSWQTSRLVRRRGVMKLLNERLVQDVAGTPQAHSPPGPPDSGDHPTAWSTVVSWWWKLGPHKSGGRRGPGGGGLEEGPSVVTPETWLMIHETWGGFLECEVVEDEQPLKVHQLQNGEGAHEVGGQLVESHTDGKVLSRQPDLLPRLVGWVRRATSAGISRIDRWHIDEGLLVLFQTQWHLRAPLWADGISAAFPWMVNIGGWKP